MATLIRIDRNGSKHWQGLVTCDRCGGKGIYHIGVHNGELIPAHPDNGVCYKCNGAGKVMSKWIERTPEYQAKLDAKRQAKLDAIAAEQKAQEEEQERIRKEEEAKAEAEKLAEEARIKAQKAISQHVGEIGQRLTISGTFEYTAFFEVPSFRGFGTDTMYIHNFKDDDGNVLVWKTSSCLNRDAIYEGDQVQIKGTVKEHSEYKDEKQTVLTRCKITKI